MSFESLPQSPSCSYRSPEGTKQSVRWGVFHRSPSAISTRDATKSCTLDLWNSRNRSKPSTVFPLKFINFTEMEFLKYHFTAVALPARWSPFSSNYDRFIKTAPLTHTRWCSAVRSCFSFLFFTCMCSPAVQSGICLCVCVCSSACASFVYRF